MKVLQSQKLLMHDDWMMFSPTRYRLANISERILILIAITAEFGCPGLEFGIVCESSKVLLCAIAKAPYNSAANLTVGWGSTHQPEGSAVAASSRDQFLP